jgi:type IV pilus assembly protein PilX
VAKKQDGFILVVSLILLITVTVLVVNGMRNTVFNEKMAGNHMDRNRAYQAAEQALRQGVALLQSNANVCVYGCTNSNLLGVGPSVTAIPSPSVWPDTYSQNVTLANGQLTTAQFLINQLPDSMLPPGKNNCEVYSVIGCGQGIDPRSVVMLQTTAFVCPF